MPLHGALTPDRLTSVAVMPDLTTEAWSLSDVTVLHAFFEAPRDATLAYLPPALAPTIPASIYVTAWSVPESPLGPFRLAQVRLGCRAGMRGRGLLTGAVVDSERVAAELEARWGFRCRVGSVELTRTEQSASLSVHADDRLVLELPSMAMEPISGAVLQWPASLHPARVTSEPRSDAALLIQVDPEYEFGDAARGKPRATAFDSDFWGVANIRPTTPIAASVARVRLQLPRLRFVVAPEASVFDSARRVNAEAE